MFRKNLSEFLLSRDINIFLRISKWYLNKKIVRIDSKIKDIYESINSDEVYNKNKDLRFDFSNKSLLNESISKKIGGDPGLIDNNFESKTNIYQTGDRIDRLVQGLQKNDEGLTIKDELKDNINVIVDRVLLSKGKINFY